MTSINDHNTLCRFSFRFELICKSGLQYRFHYVHQTWPDNGFIGSCLNTCYTTVILSNSIALYGFVTFSTSLYPVIFLSEYQDIETDKGTGFWENLKKWVAKTYLSSSPGELNKASYSIALYGFVTFSTSIYPVIFLSEYQGIETDKGNRFLGEFQKSELPKHVCHQV